MSPQRANLDDAVTHMKVGLALQPHLSQDERWNDDTLQAAELADGDFHLDLGLR